MNSISHSFSTSMMSTYFGRLQTTGLLISPLEKGELSNLRYADDITLIALYEEKMTDLLNLVKIANKKLKLLINASKIKSWW